MRTRDRLVLTSLVLLTMLGPGASAAVAHGDAPHGDDAARFEQLAVPSTRTRAAAGAAADHLADTSCGSRRTTDDSVDAVDTRRPVYKVVYAHPSDQADRSDRYADPIASLVRATADVVLAQSDGRLALRVDQGTSCGPRYLDLARVTLPRTTDQYRAQGANLFDAVESDVRRAVGAMPAGQPVNMLVFADHLGPTTGYGGQGTFRGDERPGRDNRANDDGATAIVYGWGEDWFVSSSRGASVGTVVHEVFHNLGAVADSAPHSSGAAHCWQEWDIMCYPDGGPTVRPMRYDCDGSYEQEILDCGGDDYFANVPAAGSYLATHWNVRDSVFLCRLERCATRPEAPTARIQGPGAATVGDTLRLDGSSSGDPDGTVTGYAWTAGPGLSVTESSPSAIATVTASRSGASWVELTVTDDEGVESSTTRHSIAIADRPKPAPDGQTDAGRPGATSTPTTGSSTTWTTTWSTGRSWTTPTETGGDGEVGDDSAGIAVERPAHCRVPRLRGRTTRGARIRLRRAKCDAYRLRWTGRIAGQRVRRTRPAAGALIRRDQAITVWMARRR